MQNQILSDAFTSLKQAQKLSKPDMWYEPQITPHMMTQIFQEISGWKEDSFFAPL